MNTEPKPTTPSVLDPHPLSGPTSPLQLWPATAVLALYWTACFVIARLETFYFVGFLFNLVSSVLLGIFFLAWWWANRRLSLRRRLFGFLFLVGGGLIVAPLCHESIGWWGLLLSALPIVLTAWILWMIVARGMAPSRQWLGSVVVILLALSYFTLIRLDGLDSNLRADLHWRWEPSAEELFLTQKKRTAEDASERRESSWAGDPISPSPDDWPEFRGRDRDGVIHGITIATDWDKNPPPLRWRQRVGPA